MSRRGTRGLSLIEVLAAMAIFGILATMTNQALLTALKIEPRLEDRRSALAMLQRAVTQIARDLENAVPIAPAEAGSALRLGEDGQEIVFARGGVANPAGLPRSGYQRVAYLWDGDAAALDRRVWTHLTATPRAAPRTDRILSGVTALTFRAYSAETGWRDSWPPAETPEAWPTGLDIVLTTETWGEIRRVVSLP
ncbi:MAG: type II secretion system minor pseudopilin GspJ [Pseudomonadota bacterium]